MPLRTLYWSNTIHLPIPAIQASVEPAVFRSRPYAFSLLGMSLAPLLEIRGLSDVVVYTNRTLDQFDSAAVHVAGGPSVNKTGTMKGIFKGGSKSGKRPSVGAGGGPGGDASGGGGLAGDFGADFLMVYNQVRTCGVVCCSARAVGADTLRPADPPRPPRAALPAGLLPDAHVVL